MAKVNTPRLFYKAKDPAWDKANTAQIRIDFRKKNGWTTGYYAHITSAYRDKVNGTISYCASTTNGLMLLVPCERRNKRKEEEAFDQLYNNKRQIARRIAYDMSSSIDWESEERGNW